MQTFPNQRVIEVKKEPANKENPYSITNLSAMDKAAIQLQSKGGFKLWTYINRNQQDYEFALSSKAFMQWSGLSQTAYTTAFNELIEYNYLVRKDETNRYTFYESGLDIDTISYIEFA